MTTPYQNIEAKAHTASPDSDSSIQELTQAVVDSPHVFVLPSAAKQLLKSKLARAEIAYRNGLGAGVSEGQVVDLLNTLGNTFKFPAYSATTSTQVRHLRMKILIAFPVFMTSSLRTTAHQKGGRLSDVMSPLQAMHLIGVMIDQKVLNDDYQDPTIDISAAEEKRSHALRSEMNSNPQKHSIIRSTNPKHDEMRAAVYSAGQSMTVEDSIELMRNIGNTLHLY